MAANTTTPVAVLAATGASEIVHAGELNFPENIAAAPPSQAASRANSHTAAALWIVRRFGLRPPPVLRRMCESRIAGHLTTDILKAHEAAEESERGILSAWADRLQAADGGRA